MKTYKGLITELPENGVFIFGANVQGRHGAGTARIALQKFGAVYGEVGWNGQSYGIVTKDLTSEKHPSITSVNIKNQIKKLYDIALLNLDKEFYVAYTAHGRNLNGYTSFQMAKMFAHWEIPDNLVFEEGFAELIKNIKVRWTYKPNKSKIQEKK